MSKFDETEENLQEEMGTPAEAEIEAETEAEAETEILAEVEDSELAEFDAAEIEEIEVLAEEQVDSILESLLFASDRPVSLATLKASFKGSQVKTDDIKKALARLTQDYEGGRHGVQLEEVAGGYRFRTKLENIKFLTRAVKPRVFKLSGPALEVLSIVAYKQPVVKSEIDEIRGVESGHLLRALMEKALVSFEGKSDLPGKPMQYGTTRKFLEIFSIRNLKELPTLSQIDEILPDGIGDDADLEKESLSELTGKLSQEVTSNYSEGESELNEITDKLSVITTTSQFFEDEKQNERKLKEQEKASALRTQIEQGVRLSNRDLKWLERYDLKLLTGDSPDSAEPLNTESVARFSEEEDISLDQDLNVPEHDIEA